MIVTSELLKPTNMPKKLMLYCSKVLQGRIGDSELQTMATLPQHAPHKFTRT